MFRIGIAGLDGSHAEDFLRLFNTEERHPGFQVTRVWDDEPTQVAAFKTQPGCPVAVGSLDELVSSIDGILICHRHGGRHVAPALAALSAGKPTFVDKMLATRFDDAETIATTAMRTGTPLLSGSALRWHEVTARVRTLVEGMRGKYSLQSTGTWFPENAYGGMIYYAIHAIELLQAVIGPAWNGLSLDETADLAEPRFVFRTQVGEMALQLTKPTAGDGTAFALTLMGQSGPERFPIDLSHDYMAAVADRVIAIFSGRNDPVASETLLSPIRMANEMERLLASCR